MGNGIWGHLHVEDLAMLYEILVVKILAEEELSSGKKGIHFSDSGKHECRDVAEGIAHAIYALGFSKTQEVRIWVWKRERRGGLVGICNLLNWALLLNMC